VQGIRAFASLDQFLQVLAHPLVGMHLDDAMIRDVMGLLHPIDKGHHLLLVHLPGPMGMDFAGGEVPVLFR
jgi:hypothetical protein